MRTITTRQRFALIFTLYVFSFLIILYSLFFVIFSFMSDYQLRKDLSDDMTEIINNHLLLDKNQIIFRKDKTGASLRQFLLNENASAMIISSDTSVIRSYGAFVYDGSQGTEYNKVLLPLVNQSAKTKSPTEKQIIWNGQNLKTMVIPLVNNSRYLGSLILAKSTGDLMSFQQTMMTVLYALGILSLIGSYIVGYVLARRTLNPLIRLARVVEQMDLERLGTNLTFDGHPQDELVLLVKKFNEMMDRLNDMSMRQKEFIANASHELKTPLTRAISSLEALDAVPQTKEQIKLIKGDLFHINDLLNKLLLLTKLKKDISVPTKPHQIRLNTLFSTLRKLFDQKLKEKRVVLVDDYPELMETVVPREYLEMILSNLLSNAIKYTNPQKRIMIVAHTNRYENKIEIEDEGIGMTKEETSHMFDRFYRSKINKVPGYGIGLSIVKQICDIYGVDIKVNSQKNKGTKITLIFKKNS